MKNFKRLLTMLLALLMVLAVPAMAEEAKPDTWIADRTITFQVYVDDVGYTLPEDINETLVGKKITEMTGIKLDIRYTPGESDAAVMASQLAAGNIPDVIMSYLNNSTRHEFPVLLKAAQEGLFADVSSYFADSEIYSHYLEEGYLPKDTVENIMWRDEFDGAVYLVSRGVWAEDTSTVWNPETAYVGGTYIRSDIVEALGIDPKSIDTEEELYDLCVAIKNGGFTDDNGNPLSAVIGPKYWGGNVGDIVEICKGLTWGWDHDAPYAFDENGMLKHEAETDLVYDKIAYIRKLLDEGLLHQEVFTMDTTRCEELYMTKSVAICVAVHNYVEMVYASDDWVKLGPLVDRSGESYNWTSGKSSKHVWAISADAENPEEIFKYMDFLSTYEGQLALDYGVEGETYDMVDGYPKLRQEIIDKMQNGEWDWLIENTGLSLDGSAVYFWEFAGTHWDEVNRYGEQSPGAGANTLYDRAIQIAVENAPDEIRLIPGLAASAYLSLEQFEDTKAALDLMSWDETFAQACFASSDEEVVKIIESFRKQLKSAGIEEFEQYITELYAEDPEAVCLPRF